MRPAQWIKNLFVFLPMVFAEELFLPSTQLRAGIAFALFCALSSAVYLFNDLLDRDKDRRHPTKRHRPLAAGTLSATTAITASAGLAVVALLAAAWLGTMPLVIAAAYLLQNLLYTLWLKRIVIIDILVIALGFVLRVMMGGAALPVEVSDWLLLCTIFLSLFLAVSKRRHEVLLLEENAADQREVLDHYGEAFLDQMTSVATAATLLAYSLYATTHPGPAGPSLADNSILGLGGQGQGLGGGLEFSELRFKLVYTVPFVIFGIFRYLYLVYQKGTERSPTEAMLKDRPFLANLLVWGTAVLACFYL